jgi:release factor glutamine methyltransferase
LYQPAEDSFFLAECAKEYCGNLALEMGAGSGIILNTISQNFNRVVGTDIDYVSLQYYKSNLPKNSALVCCDAASAFAVKFDFIVSNPPYLSDHDKQNKDHTIDGGPTGIEATLHFIRSAVLVLQKRGKMLTIISSLSDSSKLDKFIKEMNLKKRLIKIRKLFFETLYIIEISFDIA